MRFATMRAAAPVAIVSTLAALEYERRKRSRVLAAAASSSLSMDIVIREYEFRLRENASLQKIHKYFSSEVYDGRDCLTFPDMVRALTPGAPPSIENKPINVPIWEPPRAELEERLNKPEAGIPRVPEMFKTHPDDLGIISFGRFLVYLTMFSIPSKDVEMTYKMFSGDNFATDELRGDEMNATQFDFLMSRSISVRGAGYDPSSHSKRSVVRSLFGKNLDQTLSLEEFTKFHKNLRQHILDAQFALMSDEPGRMTHRGFGLCVASLVPTAYRHEIERRAQALSTNACVTLDEYKNFKECIAQLDDIEQAVFRYSYSDGHFTRSNIRRATRAVANVELSESVVSILFALFDPEQTGELHHDEFVKKLRYVNSKRLASAEHEGLGLAKLVLDVAEVIGEWLEGTTL